MRRKVVPKLLTSYLKSGILKIYRFVVYLFFSSFLFFLFFSKGGGFILNLQRFNDIESIYQILDITDEYILSKENEQQRRLYIYEIDPIPIINITDDMQSKIVNSYITFLREINIDFQILLINKKLNIENIFNSDKLNSEKYGHYLEDMRLKLKEDKIIYTRYFIVVSLNKQEDIDDIDKSIFLLKNCGCNVSRLNKKRDIEEMLYECINKEELNYDR